MDRRTSLVLALAVVATTTAAASAASAEFVPVVPRDIARLAARQAKLYIARPARHRGRGAAAGTLYPGDVVTAAGEHSFDRGGRASPTFIEVLTAGGARQVLHIEELSQRPLDYSYRDQRQRFDAFVAGLASDTVRLLDLYQRTLARHKYLRPSAYDQGKKVVVDDWYLLEALRAQFQWVRSRFFDLGYSHRNERSLLEREKDWLPRRGEEFITQYAGQLAPEKKKRLQEIYLTCNALDHVPHVCFEIGRRQEALGKPADDVRYRDLEPAHRARLQAEDIAREHTKITELKARLIVTLTQARTRLLAIGVKAR